MKKLKLRNRHLFLMDLFFSLIAYVAVIAVVYPLEVFKIHFVPAIINIVATAVIYCSVFKISKVYNTHWVYAGTRDYLNFLFANFLAVVLSLISGMIIANPAVYLKLNLAANAVLFSCISATRFLARMISRFSSFSRDNINSKRLLIVGAGELAVMLIRDIHSNSKLNYNIVGLIDDDPAKRKLRMYGTSVLGNRNDIERICEEKEIEEIIFAIYTATGKQKSEILDICSNTGCKVRVLPSLDETLRVEKKLTTRIRDVEIEDLLDREPIKLDNQLVSADICGKTILVTGGGGSIGSELCRQIIKYKPSRLIILDIYENTTYELQNELTAMYPEQALDVLIASVRDIDRLESIFDEYRPDMVFHAAAHKHVPLMEYSPGESIKNNVFGTYNTARCADKYAVKRFVLISTDKAVNPTNVMGASKRLCEMIVQTFSKTSETDFVAVRFGNVLGSNGSVIPFFKKQIANGGPVTVTHPEITRFFMTIPEAAQLVLQAGSYAKGGEIFILDMGQPVKIYDLAKKMIKLSGLRLDEDIKIEFTGLRPGEKLYEELLMDEEGLQKTGHNKIFVGKPIDMTKDELDEILDKLQNSLSKDNEEIKIAVSEVVPTYSYKPLKEMINA